MVTLLAHSMMMFYLIGKGKAVKDAMAEHQRHGRLLPPHRGRAQTGVLHRHARDGGRRWSRRSWAPASTRGVLPPIVHAMIAYGAIACNVAALKIEIAALSISSRIVDEVNRLIDS